MAAVHPNVARIVNVLFGVGGTLEGDLGFQLGRGVFGPAIICEVSNLVGCQGNIRHFLDTHVQVLPTLEGSLNQVARVSLVEVVLQPPHAARSSFGPIGIEVVAAALILKGLAECPQLVKVPTVASLGADERSPGSILPSLVGLNVGHHKPGNVVSEEHHYETGNKEYRGEDGVEKEEPDRKRVLGHGGGVSPCHIVDQLGEGDEECRSHEESVRETLPHHQARSEGGVGEPDDAQVPDTVQLQLRVWNKKETRGGGGQQCHEKVDKDATPAEKDE
mmetsp:Transcript_23380/g.58639  ORF Transcript_23380/g.58639 Transcript_23380/m.58639 type:complete len:276 (-) Transcript_23380:360-1187(-)